MSVSPNIPSGIDTVAIDAARNRHKSVVSVNIIISYLQPFTILSYPKECSKHFKWCIALFDRLKTDEIEDVDDSLLYICGLNDGKKLLERSPSVFLLILTKSDEIPEWVKGNRSRIILVRQTNRFLYLSAIIQNLFTGLLVWENELDRIVLEHGSLGELLEEGARALNNFICITDAGHNLVARTGGIEAPDVIHRSLVDKGCYSVEEIEHLESEILEKAHNRNAIVTEGPRKDCPFTVLHMPIYINDVYFFHLTMVCMSGMRGEGAHDFFELFANRVVALCNTFWEDKMKVESPWYKVFTNLIDGIEMPKEYIEAQLEQTAIPSARQFRLLLLDVSIEDDPALRARAIEASKKLNSGFCYPFAYNGKLLVLCYTLSGDDGYFSERSTEEDVEKVIYEPFGIKTSASRLFWNIRDLDKAYRQTRIALDLSYALDAQNKLGGLADNTACYSFEYAFPYYLLTGNDCDKDFIKFSTSDSVLEKIARKDRETGSETVALLWVYLCTGNATAVSKQLHIHRNTVLYHIEKIEKRFGFSLDNPLNRNKLNIEFLHYFLTDGFTRIPSGGFIHDEAKKKERDIS